MEPLELILIVVGALVCVLGGFGGGVVYRRKVAEREIGSAEAEATRLINEAIRSGESRKKEMLLEAKDEIHKSRTEYEREVKERRAELSKQERRLEQKEATLDKKTEAFERKEEELSKKLQKANETVAQAEELKKQQQETLERISELTQEEAKQYLLKSVEDEVRHESAMKIKEIEQQMKDEAEEKGREIIATAIQRCAADHAAETTVSVVALPSDEMKGRIIGREGRNIRTLETITGVDLIIDDTPEAITVSSFDPVRREIARLALEKLIADGRIHPTRIEDMVEKARKVLSENKFTDEASVLAYEKDTMDIYGDYQRARKLWERRGRLLIPLCLLLLGLLTAFLSVCLLVTHDLYPRELASGFLGDAGRYLYRFLGPLSEGRFRLLFAGAAGLAVLLVAAALLLLILGRRNKAVYQNTGRMLREILTAQVGKE